MLENALIMVAIIFIVNVLYVSIMTVRMILTLKGRTYIAAFVSIFEMVMYVVGLMLVLDNLNQFQNVIAYAVGFATGLIIGSKIEEKLALGYITVNVVSANPDLNFTQRLREKGYGVTSWSSYGMDGDRLSVQILTPRKYELRLYETIHEIDPKAFIISYEPKRIHGGFWVKQVRKGKLMRKENNNKNKEQTQNESQSKEQSSKTEH
ncbi:UPF0316 protein YebE [Oceanobacillus oncorhynchi subsp. incaldanensis]|uniref:UPF0316 protein BN997_02806 n=2 Tax=Oceanobacillus TaxID=182709 RepID=A0A0A1MIM0_9BACI|nr:DUF2179 domain-containing protein [Oceanobacillus oncorhynchi]MDM8100660.1 DUF2179 domain-containing protein [Oceanobacillus oncorhynchi]UUI41479.1 DUF2179 domain-containing protein [Oceanobacillus oncorhynchi]GIO17540.1 UPF0316 protein YebE [Oceanobacillus oncorhynchi subsp. incaldanensis]CEI82918.1 hypothetical protein BN997_02806 [Oceanobacillus oncorhynchi]